MTPASQTTLTCADGRNFDLLNPDVDDVSFRVICEHLAKATCRNHGIFNGTAVYLTTTGALPTPLTASTIYYAINVNRAAETFQLAATPGGAAINTSGSQSGVHTANLQMTQAEVISLSRNVKLRSTSATAMTFVNVYAGAAVDVDWTEFYFIGNGSGKRGVELVIQNSASLINMSIKYSSFHDGEAQPIYINQASQNITTLEICYNTFWNFAFGLDLERQTANNWTVDHNIFMRTTGGGSAHCYVINDLGGAFTNNTSVGGGGNGVNVNPSGLEVFGTWGGNVSHANGGALNIGSELSGDMGSFYGWLNNFGVSISSFVHDFSMAPTLIGNATRNIDLSGTAAVDMTLSNAVLGGHSSFSVAEGIRSGPSSVDITINTGEFSTVSGILTAHTTSDINFNSNPSRNRVIGRNVKFGAATFFANPTNLTAGSYLSFDKYGQVAGVNKTINPYGTVERDAAAYNTAAPSVLMTPSSATFKLESSSCGRGPKCEIDSGTSVTAAVYIRKTAAYNGNQPRLGVRANPAVGIMVDTILATYSAGTGAWNQISGATPTATADGVVEFFIDCDGTAGAINYDDVTVA
ncbi:hypothetical protein FFI89_018790 [Bradyrhizobium sp. KBS0727]|uniref:hypothetical protein n=1 Tax=unclassified Bradyrhizobium TaxID=2631580 RepID=UPI00110DCFF1|nr:MULTISPECIES: hypothetical protein [unclassified Bradyrhizobium]QDW39013.1 hypothetical protein FFI71_018790 [Bradyrhizobium sp. KBS0725]QDW45616.1 hypothetical protein FFI89_018790 [Bradyrhizobium sp. KBS0727]